MMNAEDVSSEIGMELSKEENVSSRWVSPDKADDSHNILWVSVARDGVILAEVGTDNPKIQKASRRLLKKQPKTGWDFYTYAIESQRRLVQAVKFHVYEKVPLTPGSRAKLRGLENEAFLNGMTVRILDYLPDQDKYLVRPTVPLPDGQKLSATGQLLASSQFVAGDSIELRVWTFACLYNGKDVNQQTACYFMEKIVMLSEFFRKTEEWRTGGELSGQQSFAPILKAQMEQFQQTALLAVDESLEFSKQIVAANVDMLSSQAF